MNEEAALAQLRRHCDEIIELGNEFERSKALGHADALGFEREEAVRRLLAYQFQEFSVLHRPVVRSKTDGPLLGQYDIVVTDPLVPPHIVSTSGRHTVVDPQTVHSALEIKSTLDSPKLREALDHLFTLQNAPRASINPAVQLDVRLHGQVFPYVPVSGGIVAYTSKLSLSAIASKIEEWAVSRSPEVWPNFVTVLDRGHLMWCNPLTGNPRPWAMPGDKLLWYSRNEATDPIAAFTALMEVLAQPWNVPGTKPVARSPKITGGIKIGSATRPPGVPEPDECDCSCANCHLAGRVSFAEQHRRREQEDGIQQI